MLTAHALRADVTATPCSASGRLLVLGTCSVDQPAHGAPASFAADVRAGATASNHPLKVSMTATGQAARSTRGSIAAAPSDAVSSQHARLPCFLSRYAYF